MWVSANRGLLINPQCTCASELGSDCMARTCSLANSRHFGSKSVIISKEIVVKLLYDCFHIAFFH